MASKLERALFDAVLDGDPKRAESAIKRGADIHTRLVHKETFLHHCLDDGIAIARLLLERGADIEARDDAGQTPLMWAVGNGALKAVRMLLEKGADATTTNRLGETPVHAAVAAEANNAQLLRAVIGAGADVSRADRDGNTPLELAVEKGETEAVRVLVDAGARYPGGGQAAVRRSEYLRWGRALIGGLSAGMKSMALGALRNGADPNFVADPYGTPLQCAAAFSDAGMVKRLLRAGADVNFQDGTGSTALMSAVDTRQVDTAAVLLERGADPNLRDRKGRVCLTPSLKKSHRALYDLLVAHGARTTAAPAKKK